MMFSTIALPFDLSEKFIKVDFGKKIVAGSIKVRRSKFRCLSLICLSCYYREFMNSSNSNFQLHVTEWVCGLYGPNNICSQSLLQGCVLRYNWTRRSVRLCLRWQRRDIREAGETLLHVSRPHNPQ